MDRGVYAELEVTGDSICHVADASRLTTVRSVSRSAASGEDVATVDFTADTAADLGEVREVFEYDDKTVYRVARGEGEPPQCACEVVECHGCPVRHLQADDGGITFTFVASDLASLREIVVDLREHYAGVSLRRLTRSEQPDGTGDLVFVDRTVLTDRQCEVLETAHEMGYFDHPKRANATEVAERLDINRSTFAEHLSAAQSKLLDVILDE
ncbi:hypothetical protein SAMN04487949_3376 [Halogranum gelatinilyticum]|uniref:HTH bat-type domain-containing protein n=1 Tax=Halogranum gelatinilyticum TaxID=660521 RepID=A0A1G9YP84_9EURY|nr:helix-turn-helix domain-containing protein [Halogranum gelatinilyticum]SDN10303.1 hypothetical protein SAMN04487949_3376 [Halogranum gelatinilyticum]